MNGSNITHSELTTFQSVTSEFETTMIARLPLDAVDCAMGGVSCVFDNGMVEYGVQSPMMDCPTGNYYAHDSRFLSYSCIQSQRK